MMNNIGKGLPLFFLFGESGSYKSSIAIVMQSFYGPFSAKSNSLPSGFNATENAIEAINSDYNNCICSFDEFTYDSNTKKSEKNDLLIRLARTNANHQPRHRTDSSGKLIKDSAFINTTILVNGEHPPVDVTGSIYKRFLFNKISVGDIEDELLAKYQTLAASGQLAQFTTNWIMHIIKYYRKYETMFAEQTVRHSKMFDMHFDNTTHKRSKEHIVSLMAAMYCFIEYCYKEKIIGKKRKEVLYDKTWNNLIITCKNQQSISKNNTVSESFIDAIVELHDKGSFPIGNIKNVKENNGVKYVAWHNTRNNTLLIPRDIFKGLLWDLIKHLFVALNIFNPDKLKNALKQENFFMDCDGMRLTRRKMLPGLGKTTVYICPFPNGSSNK